MNKIVLFGASGDLAKRKILPSIANICTDNVKVYGYARSDLTKTYATEIRKFYNYSASPETQDFPEKIVYIRGEYSDVSPLKGILDKHTIVYLSLPPHVYGVVLSVLLKYDVGIIAIEKPFGTDFESFKELLEFKNDRVHFIDHYLLKPLVLEIRDIYNRKPWLFDFLNKDNIRSVECLFLEKLLAEGRAYFDKYGIIKDVMQNHLAEVLTSFICDHSRGSQNESRRQSIKDLSIEDDKYILGQYNGYKEEMKNDSNTETFAAFKCKVNNGRWGGVPFLMAGGKGLKEKVTGINFNIKKESFESVLDMIKDGRAADEYNGIYEKADKVSLIFNVSPVSEIFLKITVDGEVKKIVLCEHEEVCELQQEHARGKVGYEQLFDWMINGEPFPSVSFEEAAELWRVFTNILGTKKKLIYYEPGIEMPEEAQELKRAF